MIHYDSSKMKIANNILTDYYVADTEIVIPDGVIGIAEDVFRDFTTVEKVDFPKSLLWIGSRAFKNCRSLKNVIFPDSLVEIADAAFEGCSSITTLKMPASVYRIGSEAFKLCQNLKTLICVEGLVRIDAHAFTSCHMLEQAELPSTCEYIHDDAFADCPNLVVYALLGSEAYLFAEANNLHFRKFSKKLSFDDWKSALSTVTDDYVIRNNVLVAYNGYNDTPAIPDGVSIIGSEAFMQNYQLKTIAIPDSVIVVGAAAFSDCTALESFTCGSPSVYICENAFENCSSLAKISLTGAEATLMNRAFSNCVSLSDIILPDNNVIVCRSAFENCSNIRRVKMPVFNSIIDENAFPAVQVTYYLSCQADYLDTLHISCSSLIHPYAYEPKGYSQIYEYATKNTIQILYSDHPEDIRCYLLTYDRCTDVEDAGDTSTDTPTTTKARVDYKNQIQIDGIPKLVNCDIVVDGTTISDEQIIRHLLKYTLETINKSKHNTGVVVHSGSECFNDVLFAVSAIETLLRNTATYEDIINSLYPGDYVLYEIGAGKAPTKYIFEKNEGGFIGLKKANPTKEKLTIPFEFGYRITPYYGDSESTSDVGLRKSSLSRIEFYENVLDIPAKEVPKMPNASLVVLASRAEASRLWKSIGIKYEDRTFMISDLMTAAFYTESGASYFAGNPGKNDPVVKFTDNIFKARELVNSHDGNQVVGVLILSADYFDRSYSELADIISSKKVGFVYSSIPLSRYDYTQLLSEQDDMTAFVCSPEYISQYLDNNYSKEYHESEIVKGMNEQLSAIINRKISEVVVPCGVSEHDYFELREALLSFKHSSYDLEEKDLFVINGLSALKILMSALFPIDEIAAICNKISFEDRLEQLKALANELPQGDRIKANGIIDTLAILYLELRQTPGKQVAFKELLNEYPTGKIALIVPKAYYAQVLYSCDPDIKTLIDSGRLLISTATRFDASLQYSAVIFISNTFGKGFAPQRCFASENIIALMYECERKLYIAGNKQIAEMHSALNAKSFYPLDVQEAEKEIGNGVEQVISDEELDDYIEHLSNDYLLRPLKTHFAGQSNVEAEIAVVVSFETGERAFLTKHYTPYVLDEVSGEIKSPDVSKLSSGDIMVFNTDYFGTRDIVDIILADELKTAGADSALQKYYDYSRHWKQVLRDQMSATGKNPREIAKDLKDQGISVSIPTIIGWMDDDSHTVGPQDPAVMQQIGYYVGDEDMFSNPDRYLNACRHIREKRGTILKYISRTMLALLGGTPQAGEVPPHLRELIGRLARTYRIERIQFVTRTVPLGITNHPIDEIEM